MNTETYWREIFRYLGYKNGARPEGGTLRMIERAEADIRAAAEPKHAKRYFALSFPDKGAVEIDGRLAPGEWDGALRVTDFRRTQPLSREPARLRTEAAQLRQQAQREIEAALLGHTPAQRVDG